jgi:hypothetical protein
VYVQDGSGAHPASYPMGMGARSLEIKRPGRETDHSHLSSAEVKNVGAILPLRHKSSWRGALLINIKNQ